FRHRDGRRRPGSGVRGVPPGGARLHQQAGGHRSRARADAQVRRAARRPDLGRERTRQALDLHFHDTFIPMSLVLIVEDNDKNLKLVRDVLQVKGYATLEAGTAEDGIRLAAERIPDLILMDIQLPGMSGIQALKVLRANPATSA